MQPLRHGNERASASRPPVTSRPSRIPRFPCSEAPDVPHPEQ